MNSNGKQYVTTRAWQKQIDNCLKRNLAWASVPNARELIEAAAMPLVIEKRGDGLIVGTGWRRAMRDAEPK